MTAEEHVIIKVAEEVEKLPPIPASILELRKAAADPDVDFSKIMPILSQDPGLSATLLKFANSARFGIGHQVDTVNEAILYFGMTNLAEYLAVAFTDNVIKKSFSRLHGIDEYFDHSKTVSVLCRKLAKAAGMSLHDQETFALVGLLHDIGKLILTIASDQKALPLIVSSAEKMHEIVNSEQSLWGIDHCMVGAQICQRWNFPDFFERGIERHHTPMTEDGFLKESGMVFLAHIISVPNLTPEIITSAIPEESLEELNLTPDLVIQVSKEFAEQE